MEKECENISSKENELAGLPVRRLFFKLAVPAVTAQVINVTYNMVDRMFIGHIPKIGADALTGVGVTMRVILGISAFAALVSMGGAPRASIALIEHTKKTYLALFESLQKELEENWL